MKSPSSKKNTKPSQHSNLKVKKKKKRKPKNDLQTMDASKMFPMTPEDDSDDDHGEQAAVKHDKTKIKRKNAKKGTKSKKAAKNLPKDDEGLASDDELYLESDEDMQGVGSMSQKEYMEKLKKIDPSFYKTILANSDVLEMKSSDEEEHEDPERGGRFFKPPSALEIDSDESDAEEEGLKRRGANVVTSSMLTTLEEELQGDEPLNTFREVEQVFLAAIEQIGSESDEPRMRISKYRVEGPQLFNAVVRLCLRRVVPALRQILRLKGPKDEPSKCKRWGKMKNFIKPYLRDMIKLVECVAEPEVVEVVLSRGIVPLLPFYVGQPIVCRQLLKRLISLWSTSHQRTRILAFIAIFRLTRALPSEFLDWGLKRLYLSYVRNSRFTSPSTWGMIDFMRLSLVELYALDSAIAYRHTFIYVRQMAFHLRNAILVKKKEKVQLVYNWQFIHCLHLWAELLGKTHPNEVLQPLIYPVTQVAIGTMKLMQSPRYFPLVFQVCSILTDLSSSTNTFIPVLPFLLHVLIQGGLEKRPHKASLKPFDWLCMLKLSKSQMAESAFRDGVIEQVYAGLVDYFSVESSSIGFPELTVPAVLQIRSFIKKSKVPNYTKKMKQLLEKVRQNCTFVEDKRKEVSFTLSDTAAVRKWEAALRIEGTPMKIYGDMYRKVREKEHMARISGRAGGPSNKDDFGLPTVKRRQQLQELHNAKDMDEIKELFASDEDSEDDDQDRFLMKADRKRKQEEEAVVSEGEEIEGSEEEGTADEVEDEPLKKKMKIDVQESIPLEDESDEEIGGDDEVREMRLSDFEEEEEEDDDEDEDDDFGVDDDSED